MPVGYHLPPTYYKSVPTAITICMVLFVWITLPILSYNPDLLDPLLSDYFEAWADWAKANVLKLFNFMLWMNLIQCIIAIQKCRQMGINSETTLHWIFSVAINGFFSLRYLIWPDKSLAIAKTH